MFYNGVTLTFLPVACLFLLSVFEICLYCGADFQLLRVHCRIVFYCMTKQSSLYILLLVDIF